VPVVTRRDSRPRPRRFLPLKTSHRVTAVLVTTVALGTLGATVAQAAPWYAAFTGWPVSWSSPWGHRHPRPTPTHAPTATATTTSAPASTTSAPTTSPAGIPTTSTVTPTSATTPLTTPATTPATTTQATTSTAAPTTATTTRATTPPAGGVRALGFSAGDALQLSQSAMDQRFTDLEAAGAGWIRLDLGWKWVQAGGPGSYNWANMDQVIASAHRHHLNVVLIPDYAPTWAAASGCTALCAPRSATEYATFVGAAVKHFAPLGVRTWELWNEPNIRQFFSPKPDATLYAAMVKAAGPAAHAADPGATVLTAGLAPSFTAGGDLSPQDVVSALYAQGARGSFDAVAMHPYTYPADPSSTAAWTGWTQLLRVRDVMVANGDAAKKVWLTEVGAPTNGPGAIANGPTYSGTPDHVSEAYQASIATQAVTKAASYDWAGPLFWYDYQDLGTAANDKENFFGLLRHDGSRKPSYAAFVTAAQGTTKTTPADRAAG